MKLCHLDLDSGNFHYEHGRDLLTKCLFKSSERTAIHFGMTQNNALTKTSIHLSHSCCGEWKIKDPTTENLLAIRNISGISFLRIGLLKTT
jgi:hypothetical protein